MTSVALYIFPRSLAESKHIAIYKNMRWLDAYRYSSLFTYSEETSDTQLSLRIMAAICSHSSRLGQQWAACVHVYKKQRHCMLSTNRAYWGLPVSFLRQLTVNIYSKHSQQLCKWHDNPIHSQLETLIRPRDLRCCDEKMWCEMFVWTWTPSSELPTSIIL